MQKTSEQKAPILVTFSLVISVKAHTTVCLYHVPKELLSCLLTNFACVAEQWVSCSTTEKLTLRDLISSLYVLPKVGKKSYIVCLVEMDLFRITESTTKRW